MKDIGLNADLDLLILNGDFEVFGNQETNEQTKLFYLFNKGTFKRYPQIGAGVLLFLGSENSGGKVANAIKETAKLDRATAKNVFYNGREVYFDLEINENI